jgi:hypothetical protein
MRVDLAASKRLTARIEREHRRSRRARSARARRTAARRRAALEGRRRAVDTRYDPRRSLNGAAPYLALAQRRFGREDLTLAAYHMGVGNLERAVETYVFERREVHIGVGPDAERLLPLQEALVSGPRG